MNSISSNFSATNLTAVGSADDALDMQQTIQFVVTDKIRNSILARIDNTKNIGQRLLETNGFLTRLRETNPGNYQTITVDKFLAAKNNDSDLLKLLQSDGPKLGNSLISSQSFLNELKQLNLNIQTTIRYPVLKTTLDKDSNVITTEFSFMNQAERDSLESLNKSQVEGSNSIFASVTSGDSPITTRYEIFDFFANLVPSLSDINSSISTLSTQRSSLQTQYTKELAVLSTSAKQIQEKLLSFQLFNKEDESKTRKMLEDRKFELNNAFNTFQLLKNLKENNSDINIKQNGSVNDVLKNKNNTEKTVPINTAVFIKPDINLENKINVNLLNNKNSIDNGSNTNISSASFENSEFNLSKLSVNINNLPLASRDDNVFSKNLASIKNEFNDDKNSENLTSNSQFFKSDSAKSSVNFISNDNSFTRNPNLVLSNEIYMNDTRSVELTDANKNFRNDAFNKSDVTNKSDDNLNAKKLAFKADYEKDSNNVIDFDSNYKK